MNDDRAGVPPGYGTVTPVIYLKNAAEAIDYYHLAFGATELKRVPDAHGMIAHAEIRIGGSVVVLADQMAGSGTAGARAGALTPRVELALYSDRADEVYERALGLGATVTLPISDVFWGDRYGKVMDPFGQVWSIGTRRQSLTVDEIVERARGGGVAAGPSPEA